jgi:hypothetical protein
MSILKRVAAFLALFVALQLSWQMLRGTPVEYTVVHYGTVRPAAAIIDFLSPQLYARVVAFSVRAVGGGINVLNGWEGLDAVFLLAAAFVIYDFDGPAGAGASGGGTLGNAVETVVAGGDSGGPAFIGSAGSYRLVGINTFQASSNAART